MSKFPVEISDNEGIVDAVNYLLSGPSGLGQNFAGYSSYTPAYLTGNYRTPFSQPTIRDLYVPAITLDTSEFIDSRTLKFTFSSAQPSPPFKPGDNVTVAGVSNSWYDYRWEPIGVVSCTTTYCYVRTSSIYTPPFEPIGYGGTISLSVMDIDMSTDCNARVTVTGATDRVFISGQLDQRVTALYPGGLNTLTAVVRVNRYIGFLNEDPVNPDYLFDFQATVAEKIFQVEYDLGPSPITLTSNVLSSIFTSIIDSPGPGYYWYIMEVYYISDTTAEVTKVELQLRSLSAQVVKQ